MKTKTSLLLLAALTATFCSPARLALAGNRTPATTPATTPPATPPTNALDPKNLATTFIIDTPAYRGAVNLSKNADLSPARRFDDTELVV